MAENSMKSQAFLCGYCTFSFYPYYLLWSLFILSLCLCSSNSCLAKVYYGEMNNISPRVVREDTVVTLKKFNDEVVKVDYSDVKKVEIDVSNNDGADLKYDVNMDREAKKNNSTDKKDSLKQNRHTDAYNNTRDQKQTIPPEEVNEKDNNSGALITASQEQRGTLDVKKEKSVVQNAMKLDVDPLAQQEKLDVKEAISSSTKGEEHQDKATSESESYSEQDGRMNERKDKGGETLQHNDKVSREKVRQSESSDEKKSLQQVNEGGIVEDKDTIVEENRQSNIHHVIFMEEEETFVNEEVNESNRMLTSKVHNQKGKEKEKENDDLETMKLKDQSDTTKQGKKIESTVEFDVIDKGDITNPNEGEDKVVQEERPILGEEEMRVNSTMETDKSRVPDRAEMMIDLSERRGETNTDSIKENNEGDIKADSKIQQNINEADDNLKTHQNNLDQDRDDVKPDSNRHEDRDDVKAVVQTDSDRKQDRDDVKPDSNRQEDRYDVKADSNRQQDRDNVQIDSDRKQDNLVQNRNDMESDSNSQERKDKMTHPNRHQNNPASDDKDGKTDSKRQDSLVRDRNLEETESNRLQDNSVQDKREVEREPKRYDIDTDGNRKEINLNIKELESVVKERSRKSSNEQKVKVKGEVKQVQMPMISDNTNESGEKLDISKQQKISSDYETHKSDVKSDTSISIDKNDVQEDRNVNVRDEKENLISTTNKHKMTRSDVMDAINRGDDGIEGKHTHIGEETGKSKRFIEKKPNIDIETEESSGEGKDTYNERVKEVEEENKINEKYTKTNELIQSQNNQLEKDTLDEAEGSGANEKISEDVLDRRTVEKEGPVSEEFKVTINGGTKQCFYQELTNGSRFSTHFQVLRGQDRMVDFIVMDGNFTIIHEKQSIKEANYYYDVQKNDTLAVCIDNIYSRYSHKLVYIAIDIFHPARWDAYHDEVTAFKNVAGNLTTSLTSVENAIRAVITGLTGMRFHVIQDLYRARDNRYYVSVWSGLQCVVIIICSVIQVYLVRRLFRSSLVTPTTSKPRA